MSNKIISISTKNSTKGATQGEHTAQHKSIKLNDHFSKSFNTLNKENIDASERLFVKFPSSKEAFSISDLENRITDIPRNGNFNVVNHKKRPREDIVSIAS